MSHYPLLFLFYYRSLDMSAEADLHLQSKGFRADLTDELLQRYGSGGAVGIKRQFRLMRKKNGMDGRGNRGAFVEAGR